MNKTMNTGNRFLDSLKRVLVRFKDAGFGIKFIKNLPKVADYFSDKNVSILGKSKVLLSFIVTLVLSSVSLNIV